MLNRLKPYAVVPKEKRTNIELMKLLDDTQHMNSYSSKLAYQTFEAESHLRVDSLNFRFKQNLRFMKGVVTKDMLPYREKRSIEDSSVYCKLNNTLLKICN